MAEINVKLLKISEPYALYSELNNAMESGDRKATRKIRENMKEYYLLAGLYAEDIKDSTLQEQVIGKLSSALDTDNVSYALFPADQRNGYLPLVMTSRSRAYIESTLNELVSIEPEKGGLNWFIYKLPTGIDPDSNERSGSHIMDDEHGVPIPFSYDHALRYIEGESLESLQAERESNQDELDEKEIDYGISREDVDEKAVDFTPTSMYDDDYKKLMEEADTDAVKDADTVEGEPVESRVDALVDKVVSGDEQEEDELFFELTDEDIADNVQDEDTDEPPASEGDTDVPRSGEADRYIKTDEAFEEVLAQVKLERFEPYKSNAVTEKTRVAMQKMIDDANARIDVLEHDIIGKLKGHYRKLMSSSYETVTSKLDAHTGDDYVINAYKDMKAKQNEIEENLNIAIAEKETELLERFEGESYKDFVNRWLAKSKKLHHDEFYGSEVAVPLEEYQKEQVEKANTSKHDVSFEFDTMIENMKEAAYEYDRLNALTNVEENIPPLIKEANKEIVSLKREIKDMNKELIALEYKGMAEDRFKRTAEEVISAHLAKFNMDDDYKRIAADHAAEVQKLHADKLALEERENNYQAEIERKNAEERRLRGIIESRHEPAHVERVTYEPQNTEPVKTSAEKAVPKKKGLKQYLPYILMLFAAGVVVTLLLTLFIGGFGKNDETPDVKAPVTAEEKPAQPSPEEEFKALGIEKGQKREIDVTGDGKPETVTVVGFDDTGVVKVMDSKGKEYFVKVKGKGE